MDRELIKVLSEREAALVREEMKLKFQESKAELEKLKSENERFSELIDLKVKTLKSDVSEVAIDKTLSILSHVRQWILIIGSFVTILAFILGFIGIENIRENLSNRFKIEVEKWLRFEPQDGPAKAKLDEIRTQAILDAYTIKLSRSRYSPYGIRSVELNTLEQERLLEILLEPKTSYSDFLDALRIITSSRGIIRLWHPEDDVANKIVNILHNNAYSPSKKGEVLSYMRQDQSLLPFAKSIISNPENDDSIKSLAFKNISIFDEQFATEYANKNLSKTHNSLFKNNLVEHLVKYNPKSNEISSYIEGLKLEKNDDSQGDLLRVLGYMIEDSNLNANNVNKVIRELSFLIENGVEIIISDSTSAPRYFAFLLQTNGASYYSGIKEPAQLFSNKSLLKSVFILNSKSLKWLTKVIQFFEIKEFGFYFTTLLID